MAALLNRRPASIEHSPPVFKKSFGFLLNDDAADDGTLTVGCERFQEQRTAVRLG